MTVGELLDVFDSNRELGLQVEILDGSFEVQATYRTNSPLIEKIEDKVITGIDGDVIRLWIKEDD